MPQITFLALLAALIAFLVTNPTKALTPEEEAVQKKVSEAAAQAVDGNKAPPLSMDDAKLVSEKARLIKQENERQKKIMDEAVQ